LLTDPKEEEEGENEKEGITVLMSSESSSPLIDFNKSEKLQEMEKCAYKVMYIPK
jgi:hypothetical protein